MEPCIICGALCDNHWTHVCKGCVDQSYIYIETARAALATGRRKGELIPQPCANCGNPKTEGHHRDYTRPLDIMWLCHGCHRKEHYRIKAWAFELAVKNIVARQLAEGE